MQISVHVDPLNTSPEQNLFDANISSPSEAVDTRRGKAAEQQSSYPQEMPPLETEIHPEDSVFFSLTPKQTTLEDTNPKEMHQHFAAKDRPSFRERNINTSQEHLIAVRDDKESSYKRKSEQTVSVSK